jgi:putative heme-binding domain-containing protein
MFAAFAAVVAGLAVGQPPGGPFGKGKGGGKGNDPISLFQDSQVRAELKVTEKQLADLPSASLKALAQVLSAGQLQRLRGIYLQQKGNAALLEADVQKELKLSDAQVKAIRAALNEQTSGQNEMMEAGGFDPEKMQQLQKTATAKIQIALTQDQKTSWTKLLGQPFQMAMGGPGGMGDGITGKATPVERIKPAKDFKVELLHSVPRAQGSWVSMCLDGQNRLIVSDQGGAGLFRVTPPPLGGPASETKVEKLPAAISGAQGLLWAFDSLYVVVNGGGFGGGTARPNGLYRVRSSSPGGDLDQVELLCTLNGGGEHGVHAVLLAPDRKSLFIVCGNDTRLPSTLSGSYLPKIWGEDRLFPLVAEFGGVVRPAGHIYKVDPDGKNLQLWCAGFRNAYDAAVNRHGDLFTFDSDMEFDMNQPWYRPTRICLAVSGGDFGFRNGSDNSPPRYPDTLPALYDIGPGSPTGMLFGYGAKFPAKYQEALYICDWSYGRMFAVHLTPDGSAYKADVEEFITGTPMPMTDMVVNPKDGALYFAIGGRNAQSGLYRVTYTGQESTAPSKGDDRGAEARALRHKLEAFHGKADPVAIEAAWPYLGHEDRYIRFAARTAIEHQDYKQWQERALQETNPATAINVLLALARAVGKDPLTYPRKSGTGMKQASGMGKGGFGKGGGVTASAGDVYPIPGIEFKAPILAALARIDWEKLTNTQRCDLLRVYTIVFTRLGSPDRATRNALIARFDPLFPAKNYEINTDLCQLLVYLEAPGVADKALKLMATAPSQEEQIDYAKSLCRLETGWTPAQRQQYFAWFAKATRFKGGQTLQQATGSIRQAALAKLTAKEREEVQSLLQTTAAQPAPIAKARPTVKQWTVSELTPIVANGLTKRDFDRGRKLFGEAKCFACHRFAGEGGTWAAPDLTLVSGRYSAQDLLESIIEPSKVISDQFAVTTFTLKNGRIVTGRVVNMGGGNMSVMTDMLTPTALTGVDVRDVEEMQLSKTSPMPNGLLDTFHEDEILDLMAYLLSRGDDRHEMFKK